MTEPFFLFGSFTEDEARSLQSSASEALNPGFEESPRSKENGFHSSASTLQSCASRAPSSARVAVEATILPNGSYGEFVSRSRDNSEHAMKKSAGGSTVDTRGENPVKLGGLSKDATYLEGNQSSVREVSITTCAAQGLKDSSFQDTTRGLISGQETSDPVVSVPKVEPVSFQPFKPSPPGTGPGHISVEDESSKGEANGSYGAVENGEASASQYLPKSWAALVGVFADGLEGPGPSGSSMKNPKYVQKQSPKSVANGAPPVTDLSGDAWLTSLRKLDAAGRSILPRGLVNTGNSCFVNSTMQAMLSCPPFTHLLQVLKARGVPQSGYPTLRAFVDFFKEFECLDANAWKPLDRRETNEKSTSMEIGRPFTPAMFEPVLQKFSPAQPSLTKRRNRQEDAQEFLSFVMDHMHEEILRLQSKDALQVPTPVSPLDDDDWETVGPKNRSSVTRTHSFVESAVTDIFGGQLRSVVKTKGNKASATVQPFLLLHLDIVPDFVSSVEDALRMFAAPEFLEGYKPTAGKVGAFVSASKSVKIQTLPRVLILHMMRFSYGSGGSSKLHKHVNFPLEITLGRELLASASSPGSEYRKYELVASVSHHGKDPL